MCLPKCVLPASQCPHPARNQNQSRLRVKANQSDFAAVLGLRTALRGAKEMTVETVHGLKAAASSAASAATSSVTAVVVVAVDRTALAVAATPTILAEETVVMVAADTIDAPQADLTPLLPAAVATVTAAVTVTVAPPFVTEVAVLRAPSAVEVDRLLKRGEASALLPAPTDLLATQEVQLDASEGQEMYPRETILLQLAGQGAQRLATMRTQTRVPTPRQRTSKGPASPRRQLPPTTATLKRVTSRRPLTMKPIEEEPSLVPFPPAAESEIAAYIL